MDIEERIVQCIALILKAEPEDVKSMSKDQNLSTVGMDSLNSIDIVLGIEENFGISFTDEELLLQNLNTINKLKQIVEQKSSCNV
jgi:acyl carrier protein